MQTGRSSPRGCTVVVYAGEGQTREGGLSGHITFTAVCKQKLDFGETTQAASGCVLTLHVNGS